MRHATAKIHKQISKTNLNPTTVELAASSILFLLNYYYYHFLVIGAWAYRPLSSVVSVLARHLVGNGIELAVSSVVNIFQLILSKLGQPLFKPRCLFIFLQM